jgi:hypothetical protein
MLVNIVIWVLLAVAAFWYFGGFRYLARRKADASLKEALATARQSPKVVQLRNALSSGDTSAIGEAMSHSSWTELLAIEPDADAYLPALEAYTQENPDDLNGLFLLGSAQVNTAWKARSGNTADKLTSNQVTNFYTLLNNADQTLTHALSQHPTCEFLYPPMITAKKGLGQKEEAYVVYQQAVDHEAVSFAAAQAMVSLLAARWLGSKDEMFRFAIEQQQRYSNLPAMGAIELSAHIEHDMDGEKKNYLKSKEVNKALAAADASAQATNGDDASCRHMRFAALNNMAMVYSLRGEKKRAKSVFAELGANWHTYPWKYQHEDPQTIFAEFAKLVA